VLLNLAISEHGANKPVEALRHLRAYLGSSKVDPKKAQEIRESLYEELWRATGHLRIQAERGEAIVLDDDVKLGNAPLDDLVDVTPGKHKVSAGARSVEATALAGETKDVSLVAESATVTSMPKAGPADGDASIQAGGDAHPLAGRETSFWGVRSITGLVLLGTGAAAIGFGAASLADASSAERTMTRLAPSLPAGEPGSRCFASTSPVCADYRSARVERDDAEGRASTWLPIGISAAAVGAGLVASAILWPERRGGSTSAKAPSLRVVPTLGARESGLVVVSNF
jgi:hypothetical protein